MGLVFNLLAVLLSYGEQHVGARTVALRTLTDFGIPLVGSETPAASIVAHAFRQAENYRESVRYSQLALTASRFRGKRYALDQSGPRSKILFGLGLALEEAGETERAIKSMSDAVELNPKEQSLRESFCARLLAMGQRARALDCVAGLIEMDPAFAQGYFIRAQLFREMGRINEAIESAIKGLKLDPGNDVARRKLAELQRLKRETLSFDSLPPGVWWNTKTSTGIDSWIHSSIGSRDAVPIQKDAP